MNPIENLIHTTVRIECITPNTISRGTGFIFGFASGPDGNIPFVVTNKHVLEGAIEAIIHFTTTGEDG